MKTKTLLLFLLFIFATSCGGSKKNTYRIAVDPSWYPLELTGREKNVLAFSIELLQEIAKREKLQLVLVRMNWDNLIWGLREKKYQAVLSTLTPYVFYQRKYSFSSPYLLTGPVLVLPANETEMSLKEMQGKEIGVIRGSETVALLQVYPGVIIRTYDSVPEALNALVAGQVDATVVDSLTAQGYINDLYQGRLKVVNAPLTEEGLRLLTGFNETPRLIERFNKGLAALKSSGQYDVLMRKWGLLSHEGSSDEKLNREIEAFIQTAF